MEPVVKRPRVTQDADNADTPPLVVLPSHASWYRADSICSIERRSLPEYFDGLSQLKTPKAYMHMRNCIVSLYREQPGLHLSVTECRRHLAADVGAVMRLHQFLEHWGLINYNASASASTAAAARSGLVLDGPSACAVSAAAATAGATAGTSLPLRASMASGGGAWTPQQTMALLDALESTGEGSSWDDVATSVGRPIEECIGQFLALPIEEPYALESLAGTSATAAIAATAPATEAAERTANGTSTAAVTAAATSTDPMLCQLALLAAASGTPHRETVAALESARDSSSDGANVASSAMAAETEAVESAAAGLRSAARDCMRGVQLRASQLEQEESGQMTALLTTAVDTQLRRMELKLLQLDELSNLVTREREQLERMRHQIYCERIALDQRRAATAPPLLPWAAVPLQTAAAPAPTAVTTIAAAAATAATTATVAAAAVTSASATVALATPAGSSPMAVAAAVDGMDTS